MAKFLSLWEIDTTKMPDKPEEQIALYTKLLNMVKEDLEIKSKTVHKIDWGEFAGGGAGYGILEGTEQDIALSLMKYRPYVKFKLHPVLSLEQTLENVMKLSQA